MMTVTTKQQERDTGFPPARGYFHQEEHSPSWVPPSLRDNPGLSLQLLASSLCCRVTPLSLEAWDVS